MADRHQDRLQLAQCGALNFATGPALANSQPSARQLNSEPVFRGVRSYGRARNNAPADSVAARRSAQPGVAPFPVREPALFSRSSPLRVKSVLFRNNFYP